MKFREFAFYLNKLERTSSRIEITKILAELLSRSETDEIDKIVYLSLGTLAPSFKGIVFNLAERMMILVLAKAFKKDVKEVKTIYKKLGDLGDVAADLAQKSNLETKDYSVERIYNCLFEIAEDQGEGSQERKISKMAQILSELDPLSCRFVSRIPVGRLRLGFSEKTILDALSWMERGDKSLKPTLEEAYQVVPDVGLLAKEVKRRGAASAAKNVKPVIGIPVLPMLAQRLKSPQEMIKKMGEVVVEPKFDGLRVLIHFKRGKKNFIKAFTRNLNDVAGMFPEIYEIKKYLKAKEVILDSEAVGMDPEMKRLADFQTTMQRRRKYKIEEKSKEIPLRFQVFDIIYKDGKNLMNLPYLKRRKILEKLFIPNQLFVVDEKAITSNPEEINKYYKQKVAEGLEGVMVKKANSTYVPGRTGWRWVKMKEQEQAQGKLADTIDAIIMGYTLGKGKRASFGVGQFLAGILDKEMIRTITKVGTGLTDEQFRELKKRLLKIQIKEKPKNYEVHKDLYPDFWVAPKVVVEIAADELTVSPKHTTGFALRFPRLIRFRDDKSAEEATTLDEIKKLFKLQGV